MISREFGWFQKSLTAFLMVGALVLAVTMSIVVMTRQGGDADDRFLSVYHAQTRGTIHTRRREADATFHFVLDPSWNHGAVVAITVMGPTGDNATAPNPGDPWIRLCGSPAGGCVQTARVIQGESQSNFVGGMQAALEELRNGPHRFWCQFESYNGTLITVPIQ